MTSRIRYVLASNEPFARRMALDGDGYATSAEAQAALALIEGLKPNLRPSGLVVWAVAVGDFPTHDGTIQRVRWVEAIKDAAAAAMWFAGAVSLPALASWWGA